MVKLRTYRPTPRVARQRLRRRSFILVLELGLTRPARRAISELLPKDVATAAIEFLTGPLLAAPKRVGKPLQSSLSGLHSARLGTEWRVLYRIDDGKHAVIVQDVQHRSAAYRPR